MTLVKQTINLHNNRIKTRDVELQEEKSRLENSINSLHRDLSEYSLDISIYTELLNYNYNVLYKIRKDIANTTDQHLKDLLRAFVQYALNIRKINKQLDKIDKVYIPDAILKDILDLIHEEYIVELFEGKHIDFGKIGRLEILNYERVNRRKQLPPDWGESYNLLKDIAKEQEEEGLHTNYSKLLNKKLNHNTFIRAMKPFVYSEDSEESRKKPKWIMYHLKDDLTVFRLSKYNGLVKNIEDYKFKPTNFNNFENRTNKSILDKLKTKEEILLSTELGLMNKLRLVLEVEPNIVNTFKTYIKK